MIDRCLPRYNKQRRRQQLESGTTVGEGNSGCSGRMMVVVGRSLGEATWKG
jgi:hypothetical protein